MDIDETLVYLLEHFLGYYNHKHDTDFSERTFFSYRWWEVLGISKEQAYAEAEEYIKDKMLKYTDVTIDSPFGPLSVPHPSANGYFDIEFVEGAEQALNLLYFFYDLYAITDRSPLLDPDTFNISSWLYIEEGEDGNHFPQFRVHEDDGEGVFLLPLENIIYTCDEDLTKTQLCKKLGIETMIDDNAEIAYDCAEKGIRTIVPARPWNKSMPKHPRITRARDWQEVCDILVPGEIKLPYPEKRVNI